MKSLQVLQGSYNPLTSAISLLREPGSNWWPRQNRARLLFLPNRSRNLCFMAQVPPPFGASLPTTWRKSDFAGRTRATGKRRTAIRGADTPRKNGFAPKGRGTCANGRWDLRHQPEAFIQWIPQFRPFRKPR